MQPANLLRVLSLSLAIFFLDTGLQGADTIHRLDVKAGLWDVSANVSIRTAVSRPPELDKMLAGLTPQQRATAVAAFEANAKSMEKGSPRTYQLCMTKEFLDAGGILLLPRPDDGGKYPCPHTLLASTSRELSLRLDCPATPGNPETHQTFQYEMLTPESLKGTITAKVPGAYTTTETLTARRIGGCGIDKQDMQTKGTAAGANPDVLSFLPYLPKLTRGTLGRSFAYFWDESLPSLYYTGGIVGAPRARTTTQTYFHGTDGKFLYVTLAEYGGLCAGNQFYKVDKSGNAIPIPEIPNGLKGGSDQIKGGPPCRQTPTTAH